MNIAFRVDASLQIGSGHVMRCLTLANALRDKRAGCAFVCRAHDGHLAERIEAMGHQVYLLPQPDGVSLPDTLSIYEQWLGCSWQQDAEQTRKPLGNGYDWLVVDHYGLDARWETAMREITKRILAIDDLANRPHDCELLLDQNLIANRFDRYDDLLPNNCARLLGTEYALLQPQYSELHPRTPPRSEPVQRIFVYFGGSDNFNLTARTLAAFLDLNRTDIALDVVTNPAGPHAAEIRRLVQAHDNIVLHDPMPSLAPLMLKADMAVGAGGATSWERCCLGLPTLVVTIADNQKPIAEELARLGVVNWVGHRDGVTQEMLSAAMTGYLQDGQTAARSRRCMELVDGTGTGKVAAWLMLDATTELVARPARVRDEALFLQWANDPSVRDNAFNQDAIDATTHRNWYYQQLRHPETCKIFVVETTGGLPIGQVRFEQNKEGAWEIDYALDAAARGRKLGAWLLDAAIRGLRKSHNGALVLGRVKDENQPSQRIFERLGFSGEKDGGGIVYRRLLGWQ